MPIVTMPDGTHVQFPDDMPRDQIQSMIAKKFPEEIGALQDAAAKQAEPSWSASILPISKDQAGNAQFDSNAGVLGAIKRSFMLPGDVMAGKVDPTSQEGIGRSLEFASTFSPLPPGLSAGEKIIPGVSRSLKRERVPVPTVEELKSASGAGYDAMRKLGVDYSTTSVKNLANSIQSQLEQDGIISELAPKSYAVLRKLQDAPDGSLSPSAPLTGLEAARRAFANAGKDFTNPTDQLAAKRAREALDQFIMQPDPASVQAGPAGEAAALLKEARGNYAAAKRGETIGDLQEAAQLRANGANSGQNSGNSTRQRVASLLLSDKQSAGFNPEEIAALEAVNKGTTAANSTRYVGNLLGGGGGLGASVTGALTGLTSAVATGNPYMAAAGLAAPVLGAVSKKASNALTEKALSQVQIETLKRSPLYQQALAAAKMTPKTPDAGIAAFRTLMLVRQQVLDADRQERADKLRNIKKSAR